MMLKIATTQIYIYPLPFSTINSVTKQQCAYNEIAASYSTVYCIQVLITQTHNEKLLFSFENLAFQISLLFVHRRDPWNFYFFKKRLEGKEKQKMTPERKKKKG